MRHFDTAGKRFLQHALLCEFRSYHGGNAFSLGLMWLCVAHPFRPRTGGRRDGFLFALVLPCRSVLMKQPLGAMNIRRKRIEVKWRAVFFLI